MKADVRFSTKLFGRAIRDARQELKLSIRELARISDVSHSQILRIESGEFDCLTSSLARLTGSLGIKAPDLVERCILPDISFYSKAVQSEQLNMAVEAEAFKRALFDLILGGTIALVHLIRSQRPSSVACEFLYPANEIRKRFIAIARQLEAGRMDVTQRFIFVKQLQHKPAATLTTWFGFPSKSDVQNHIAFHDSPEGNEFGPWIPERLPFSIHEPDIGNFDWDTDGQSDLTEITIEGNTADVKSELEALIARVKRAASRPGAKAALARFLKVAPARISEWLSDDPEIKTEPGGFYTLKLLKWVEQQERQN